jgi:hypothetical protein
VNRRTNDIHPTVLCIKFTPDEAGTTRGQTDSEELRGVGLKEKDATVIAAEYPGAIDHVMLRANAKAHATRCTGSGIASGHL